MASAKQNTLPSGRPDFMVLLGLMPPYTVEDVKQVYLIKVRTAHPDAGGDAADFVRLQEAFDRATEYARSHAGCRAWIRSHVETYISRQALVRKFKKYGARVDIEPLRWLDGSFGADFAQLGEEVVGIHLHGPEVEDKVLDCLIEERMSLGKLRLLDLAHTNISDEGLRRLHAFTSLEHLDLRDTPVTYQGLKGLRCLPALEFLDLRGTSVGWWGRIKLQWCFRSLNVLTSQSRLKASRLARRKKRTVAMVLVWLNARGERTLEGR